MSGPASRAEAVARELRSRILDGHIRPGERLPSERELAEQAGVHRGSAREALKLLAQQRLIEIRPGGARVIPLHQASLEVLGPMLERSGGRDPVLVAQLLDVHELLLAGAARLAVERASPAELERARELVTALASQEPGEQAYLETLVALLQLVAAASHNLVLHMVGHGLHQVLATVVPLLRRVRPPASELAPALETVRIALDKRDPALAEEGLRSFLRCKRGALLGQLEARPG